VISAENRLFFVAKTLLKKFGFYEAFNKFAFNQLVYLEIYQSLSYGKQKVQIIISRGFYALRDRCIRTTGDHI